MIGRRCGLASAVSDSVLWEPPWNDLIRQVTPEVKACRETSQLVAEKRLLSSVIVRVLIPAAVAVNICLGFHLWWYGQVVGEIERACVPAAKFARLPPSKPETISEAIDPLVSILRAMGDFKSRPRPVEPTE